MQTELTQTGKLLDPNGKLTRWGGRLNRCWIATWKMHISIGSKHCSVFESKRWDYYAIFTPQHFFSATIADLGYAGNIFVYALDFATGELHEEGLVIPLSKGITLPRNSDQGESLFEDKRARLHFEVLPEGRHIQVSWPGFHDGRGISADISASASRLTTNR